MLVLSRSGGPVGKRLAAQIRSNQIRSSLSFGALKCTPINNVEEVFSRAAGMFVCVGLVVSEHPSVGRIL